MAIAPFDAAKAKEHQAAWAKYLGVPVEMTNSIGMKFVLIPPSEFEMGSTQQDVERLLQEFREKRVDSWYIERLPAETPRHHVQITMPFYLSATEVAVDAFRQFVGEMEY